MLNEEKIIKTQLIKNMLYNFVVFTLIFTIFGLIIFQAVKSYIYNSAEMELKMAVQKVINIENPRRPSVGITTPIPTMNNLRMSPNITYIIRNEQGEIINQDTMGRFYNEYIDDVIFQKDNLNKIYEILIENTYSYKGINIKVQNENETAQYIQMLVNVDSEKAIMENYKTILVVGISISIILSIIASYILSKKALTPIIEAWRKQTEFVQNASHELRTPLTIIKAKQELLLQSPESKIIDKSEDICLTLNEAKRLSKLTKDLMILARADSNNIQLQKEVIDIDKLLKEITIPYMDFANVEEKKMILNFEYGKTIEADINKIHQLIVILLDNAIKYTKPEDSIEIHTYSKDGKFVLEVKDTGIGISKEGLKHVFERFYREDKARSRKTGGIGLRFIYSKLYSSST